MIDISNNPNINSALSTWWDDLKEFLSTEHRYKNGTGRLFSHSVTYKEAATEKAKSIKFDDGHSLTNEQKNDVESFFGNFFEEYTLRSSVCCKAECLKEKAEEFVNRVYSHDLKVAIANGMIYLYEGFISNIVDDENRITEGEKIMHLLGVDTCPYCNRAYTFTLYGKEKKTRPEFDHFYSKAEYPILALSFFNLVPSCHVCNHIKGTEEIKVNPYIRGFKTKFNIKSYDRQLKRESLVSLNEDDIEVGFCDIDVDDEVNIKKLGLDSLYEQHTDYVKDLLDKVYAYDHDSRDYLADAFQGTSEMPAQVYNYVWGTYLGSLQEHNWPLAKLTKDVLEQLGIKK